MRGWNINFTHCLVKYLTHLTSLCSLLACSPHALVPWYVSVYVWMPKINNNIIRWIDAKQISHLPSYRHFNILTLCGVRCTLHVIHISIALLWLNSVNVFGSDCVGHIFVLPFSLRYIHSLKREWKKTSAKRDVRFLVFGVALCVLTHRLRCSNSINTQNGTSINTSLDHWTEELFETNFFFSFRCCCCCSSFAPLPLPLFPIVIGGFRFSFIGALFLNLFFSFRGIFQFMHGKKKNTRSIQITFKIIDKCQTIFVGLFGGECGSVLWARFMS